jgi:hypothetical protein
MFLNINTDAAVKFTNMLEKLHRSALPSAIRGALNKAAMNVKKETLIKHSKNEFTIRKTNFFKANSRVEFAKGFDVKNMKATVGMISTGLTGGNNYAVKDLEQQEQGGIIGGKAFIPTDEARTGKSNSKAVRQTNRISGIRNIINANKGKGTNKQKFLAAAKKAGVGGYVLGNLRKKIVWRIEGIRKGKIKKTALYSYDKNRTVKVSGKHFMKNASLESSRNIEQYFEMEANRQILKFK